MLILLLFAASACKKTDVIPPHSYVLVKFAEDEEYVMMETTEGHWDSHLKTCSLHATGYKFERFSLLLTNLIDTGYYLHPSVKNLFFTQTTDFIPTKFTSGSIHLSFMDSSSVKGDFQVVLEDSAQGGRQKAITGNFGINIR
jgi:hypothetical protein